MAAWDISALPLRRERHFGGRVVWCRADRPDGVFAMFAEAVARAPEREALVAGDVRLTWAGLDGLVGEVAAGLAARGIGRGDRVALFMGNRIEFVVLLYALFRLGAIAVPVGAREQGPGLGYIVGHCGARMLVVEPGLRERLPEDLAAGCAVVTLEDSGELLAGLRSGDAVPPAVVGEEEACLILYTSGTTGRPKGATITGINLVHAVMIYEHVMGLEDGDRTVVAVPMSHVTGISGAVVLMARCAGTLVIMEAFEPVRFLELASAERMTQAILVPAMYALCLARADVAAYDLSHWRIGGYGGAPMPAPVIEGLRAALPGLNLLNFYGSTETVAAQAIMPPEYAFERRQDVGLICPGGEVLVLDDAGCECPRGVAGEIWLRNATVVPGYWNDAEATAAGIVAGFWCSGDLGLVDEEGFIRVLDRIKDMINRGGYKIYTAEVESVLAEHPAVLESAVVAKPCPVLGERVHAFVALRDGADVTAEELGAFCGSRLADYKRPETFTISATPLPRNANGKLLKREMREQLLAG